VPGRWARLLTAVPEMKAGPANGHYLEAALTFFFSCFSLIVSFGLLFLPGFS